MPSREMLGAVIVMALASGADDRRSGLRYDTLLYPDPFEELNRGTFALNRRRSLGARPLTWAYRKVPAAVRRSVRRFFANLNAPSVIVNDLLQCEWRDAGVLTARTAANTTVGIASRG